MFGYGFLAVVLVLYLAAVGLDPLAIGIVLTLTLIGDTIISLWLTTNADRFGRRRVLVAGRRPDDRWPGSSSPSRAGSRCSSSPAPSASSRRPATRSGRSSPSSRRRSPRPSPTGAGRRPSPGTTSSATSRPRRARSAPGLLSQALLDGGVAPLDAYRAIVIGYAVIGIVDGRRRSGGSARPSRRRRRRSSTDGIRRRSRPRSLEGRRAQAVGPVLARRLRRRVHPAEPDGLLVPHPVRRRPGAPRRDLLRREPAGRRVVAVGGADRRADRPASTRWSSPTSRRTCC